MEVHATRNLIFGLLSFALGLFIFLILTTIYIVNQSRSLTHQNQAYISCVLNWANQTTHRSNELTSAAQRRQKALDQLIRSVAEAQNPKNVKDARAKFEQDLRNYVNASDSYNETLQQHPVPKSPKLACANVKK